jgi:hypothetical protein
LDGWTRERRGEGGGGGRPGRANGGSPEVPDRRHRPGAPIDSPCPPAAASARTAHVGCSPRGWLSGPLCGCTGRDPLCPASRRQRQIEDNPQRPHTARSHRRLSQWRAAQGQRPACCLLRPPSAEAPRGRRRPAAAVCTVRSGCVCISISPYFDRGQN